MVTVVEPNLIEELTTEQGRALLEERVRQAFDLELDEFIRRWRDGVYGDVDDDPAALELAMLLPIIGVDPWTDEPGT